MFDGFDLPAIVAETHSRGIRLTRVSIRTITVKTIIARMSRKANPTAHRMVNTASSK